MPGAEPLLELRAVMARLRAECPWKAEQTHRSLARYLLEETHETLELLDVADDEVDEAHLAEELGDLLLQVYFHASIAAERGAFTIDDVAQGITAKMHRRNPHVFGSRDPDDDPGVVPGPQDAGAVDERWQQIKAAEGAPSELPETLPALLLAAKTLQRRARAGTPTTLHPDGDLGERLLALVAEADAAGLDPEQALRDTLRRTRTD